MALETLEGMSREEWYELQRQMEQDAAMAGLGAGPVARDPLQPQAPIQYQRKPKKPKQPGFFEGLVKTVLPAAVGTVIAGPVGGVAGAGVGRAAAPSAPPVDPGPPPVAGSGNYVPSSVTQGYNQQLAAYQANQPAPEPGFLKRAGQSLTSRPFLGKLAAGATSAIMNRPQEQAAQATPQARPGRPRPLPARRRVASGGGGATRPPGAAPPTTAMKAGMTWPEAQAKGISREEWLRSQGAGALRSFNNQAYGMA